MQVLSSIPCNSNFKNKKKPSSHSFVYSTLNVPCALHAYYIRITFNIRVLMGTIHPPFSRRHRELRIPFAPKVILKIKKMLCDAIILDLSPLAKVIFLGDFHDGPICIWCAVKNLPFFGESMHAGALRVGQNKKKYTVVLVFWHFDRDECRWIYKMTSQYCAYPPPPPAHTPECISKMPAKCAFRMTIYWTCRWLRICIV